MMVPAIHPIIVTCILIAWLFGIVQRINMRLKFNQAIDITDYLHAIINLSVVIVPFAFFYSVGSADSFLAGFALAYIISTLSSVCISFAFISFFLKNPLNTKTLAVYAIFISIPSTVVMLCTGIFIQNPFVIGTGCAMASSWIGYLATLMD